MQRAANAAHRRTLAAPSVVVMVAALMPAVRAYTQADLPTFSPPQALAGADGGTEPRVSIGRDDHRWVITNRHGTAVVYGSADRGATWQSTPGVPAGQMTPTIDTDIVTTSTGRLVTVELDGAAISFVVSYSDDGGRTWTASQGFARLADQDRPWLATGPADPVTHQPRVYLLMHNLASGAVTHNMFVFTSTDGGATFGPPVPITLPGTQAWLDLQCADSGGPSGLAVNQENGRVYAFWGARSSQLGGCGASLPPNPFEINVVAATRAWVATSPDGSLGSWTQSIAVDDSDRGHITGMQLSPGAIDRAGNVYVVYPESPNTYPDYSGAAIRVRWAPPDLSRWSAPITIAPQAQPGNILAHIVAGDPGKFDVAWFAGVARGNGETPVWFETVAQVLDGMTAHPTVTTERLSDLPLYRGTASQMMGACAPPGPVQGVQNGFACGRSTDVWGVALDRSCYLTVTWPSVSPKHDPTLGVSVDATWVATQNGGAGLCAAAPPPPTATLPLSTGAGPGNIASVGLGLVNTAAGSTPAAAGAASFFALAGLWAVGRRRRARGCTAGRRR
jgi:hypothetical protein